VRRRQCGHEDDTWNVSQSARSVRRADGVAVPVPGSPPCSQEYEVIFTTNELLEGSLKYQPLRWSVWHRFSDFSDLDAALRKQYGYQCEQLGLPAKQFFGSKDPTFILERRRGLHAYFQRLVASVHGVTDFGTHLGSPALREFMQWDNRLKLLKAGSANASVLVGGAGAATPGAG
jgi:hypothetical protein